MIQNMRGKKISKTVAIYQRINRFKSPIIVISLFVLFLIPGLASSHSPSSMELQYDFINQKLSVTITHTVLSPNDHYVERVEINKNDELYLTQDYTSQPTTSTFTYTYDVETVDNDVLEVTAICSIAGSITEQITAEAPPLNKIVLIINPSIETIDENTAQDFNVSIYYNGEPMDDITLDTEVKLGSASAPLRIAEGQYRFTYTSPDVTKDLTETIDINASKVGYDDARERLQFTILDKGDSGETCPPTLDGIIDADEYDFKAKFAGGDFGFHWRIAEDTIFLAMEVKTEGWVAIGFEPSDRMKDADMIIGWVTGSGEVNVIDAYSTGVNGPHPPDTDIGGTRDILCYGGKEIGGTTIIELKRLLSTGDDRDKNIPATGELDIIWAFGQNDNFDSEHTRRGYGTLDMATGEYSEREVPSLWVFHAALMTIGFVLMLIGVGIAKTQKKKKWWLKTHKIIGVLAAIISVAGLFLGFIMVSLSSGEHFRVPHAYIGVIAIVFGVLTPILGFAVFKVKKGKNKIRSAHRWFGRIAIVLMVLNIIFGLSLAGVI
jgi:hypothetical protein